MQKLKTGDIVRVRRGRWQVVDVRAYDGCELVTLNGIEGANAGVARTILEPFERVERVSPNQRLRRVGIRRWRRRARALLATAAPPGALKAALQARIDLLPHQLEPALAVVRGKGTRVLLADEVGLGKTVQAALIVAELRLRGAADRVLILAPAGLRAQWATELQARLHIDADVVGMADLRRRASALPLGVDPWQTVPVVIASFDYVKRPEVLPAASACRWDVLIVDEAHGVATDSDRHRAVAALAARTPYVLLLTATPHNGDRCAFESLCRLGAADNDRLLVFRRTRHDVRVGASRRVRHLRVRPSAPEARMHALLGRFIRAVRHEQGDAILLAASVLQKRALSSARSLERSVGRRLASLDEGADISAEQLALPLDDRAGELTIADETPEWSAELALADRSRERRLLRELAAAAQQASVRETKIAALTRLLRRAAEPVVVFTEYRDTLLHLRESLGGRVAILHGGLGRDERCAALDAFSRGAVEVLLATDAAAEGLNLHHRCRLVVNLELPWNPMRLEQRVGRVDRIGQRRTVHAVHFIARGTMESDILLRLRERVARAGRDVDVADPIGAISECEGIEGRGDAAESSTAPGARPFDTPDLRLEAMCEAARLGAARARLDATDARNHDAVGALGWIARARRPATRARLAGRTLLIYHDTIEDGLGRAAESALVPVVLTSARPLATVEIDRASQATDVGAHVDGALRAWRLEAETMHVAYASTRLARERAIASSSLHPPTASRQRGLFDRRADAIEEATAAARQEESDDRARRLAVIERAASVVHQDAKLLLVLTP